MATITERKRLEEYWAKGKYPTGDQAADTWASFWHKEDDLIPISSVDQLPETLNNKYNQDEGEVLERRMQEAEDTLVDHTNRFQGIYDRLDECEERLDDHDEQLADHKARIESAEGRLDAHDKTLADHETRLKTAETDIVNIKAKDKEQNGRLDGHDTTLASHDKRLTASEKDIAHIQAKDKEQDGRLDGLDKTTADHDTRIKANKSAAEKNASDISDLQAADQALSQRINGATTRISDLEGTAEKHGQAIDGMQTDVAGLKQTDADYAVKFAELTAQIQALQVEGKIIPGRMTVEYPERITLGNQVPKRIIAQLYPSYVTQNVLFLGDDRAVSVDPATGDLTVNQKGESVIHVIPTENLALAKKITIKVVNPSALLTADGSLLLDVDWKIFTT